MSVGVPQLSTDDHDGSAFSWLFSYNIAVMAVNETRSDDSAAWGKVTWFAETVESHRLPVMSSRFAFSLTQISH